MVLDDFDQRYYKVAAAVTSSPRSLSPPMNVGGDGYIDEHLKRVSLDQEFCENYQAWLDREVFKEGLEAEEEEGANDNDDDDDYNVDGDASVVVDEMDDPELFSGSPLSTTSTFSSSNSSN